MVSGWQDTQTLRVLTWPSDVDIQNIHFLICLRGCEGQGGAPTDICCLQVLLCPLALVNLLVPFWQQGLVLSLSTANKQLLQNTHQVAKDTQSSWGVLSFGGVSQGLGGDFCCILVFCLLSRCFRGLFSFKLMVVPIYFCLAFSAFILSPYHYQA